MMELIARSIPLVPVDTRTAHIDMYIEKGPYLIKTASTYTELRLAQELRHQIFIQDMLGEDRGGLDEDEYDAYCDHLLIMERASGAIVGTYRMNCSLFSHSFYSEQEFDLSNLLAGDGTKIELGRACIHPDHRNGLVINLLWRGIAEYMGRTEAEMLFGCATVMSEDPQKIANLIQYLREEKISMHPYSCAPQPGAELPGLAKALQNTQVLNAEEREEAKRLLPSLCHAYIRAGAWLAEIPAWDPAFRCVDFLTILPRKNFSPVFWRRYGGSASMGE